MDVRSTAGKVGNLRAQTLDIGTFLNFSFHFHNVYWLYIVCRIFSGIIFNSCEAFKLAAANSVTGIEAMNHVLMHSVRDPWHVEHAAEIVATISPCT